MKVLFVANRVPYPPFRGDKLKIWNLATRLSDSHELDLITIAENKEDLNYYADLKKVFRRVTLVSIPKWKSVLNTLLGIFGTRPLQVAYFRSPEFKKQLAERIRTGNYDAIHIQHIRMSRFFESELTTNCILDLPDAFSLYWLRRSENARSNWMRAFAKIEYKRLLKYEKKMLPQFSLNLVCSAEDMAYLEDNTGARLNILPNGVDTSTFYPRKDQHFENGRILFTGNMDYAPNVDAVQFFCKDIFPKIRLLVPGVKFVIAGQRPVQQVLDLAADDIEITGFIPNLADEYAKAHVVIAPLRFGAGTQNKVLESMAMGVPVVCTKVGFKGLGIVSGEGAVLAESDEAFVSEIVKLLADEEYRNNIITAGGNTISSKFGWDAVAKQLETYFSSMN